MFPDAVEHLFYFLLVHVEFFEVILKVGEVGVFVMVLAGGVSGGGAAG